MLLVGFVPLAHEAVKEVRHTALLVVLLFRLHREVDESNPAEGRDYANKQVVHEKVEGRNCLFRSHDSRQWALYDFQGFCYPVIQGLLDECKKRPEEKAQGKPK